VKETFGEFYKAMFAEQVRKEDMRTVFLEYAWNMAWCDPCAADPLSRDELRQLGVFWLEGGPSVTGGGGRFPPQGPSQVVLTRLHVRYDAAHFPEDLVFQETADASNFQGRYVLHHPWTGSAACPEAKTYRENLRKRQEQEARNLASLTGWPIESIRRRMNLGSGDESKWWRALWK
jgi:hypothetical protein